MKDIDILKQRQICLENQQIKTTNLESIPENIPNQNFDTVSINSHGFRGNEFNMDKEKNTFRIFVIGGSTIFGTGASSNEQTLPSQLEKKLNMDFLEPKIHVVNAGVSGATSNSEKILVTKKILDFDPDLIIVYDGWNDAWHRERLLENFGNDVVLEIPQNSGTGIMQMLQENLNFYRTPLVIYKEFFWDKSWRYNSDANDIKIDKDISDIWKKNQEEICKTSTENDIKSILILQPILGTGEKQLTNEEKEIFPKSKFDITTLETLNSLANQLPILQEYCTNVYDYRNIFDNISESVYFDKGHVSDFGNNIIAEQIARDIHQYIN